MSTSHYQVTLHALSPDATDTGSEYADTTLPAVPEEKLRELLAAFAGLAAHLSPTATPRPEIRIKSAAGMAMILPVEGKLHFVSWGTRVGGLAVSVDDIIARVASPAPAPTRHHETRTAPSERKTAASQSKWVKVALLGVAIVAMNAITLWMLLLKPPRTLAPPHVFLPENESDALMGRVAGVYQTGPRKGDRRLVIEKLGLLRFAVYGENHALRRERSQTARGARIQEGPVIITDEYGVLRLKDPNTVSVYGDTYRRIQN